LASKRGVPPRKTLSKQNLLIRGVPAEYIEGTLGDYVQDDEYKSFFKKYLSNLHLMYEDRVNLCLYGANGTGKSQPLYSKVLTESGWVCIGDLKVGDKVYNRKGKLVSVTGIYPQGLKKNYRVKFLDGRTTECCDEHLWTYYTSRGNFKTKTLKELMASGFKNEKTNSYKFYVPNNELIPFKEARLPIDPYVLGVLLGDGCFSNPQVSTKITTSEIDIINKVQSKLGKDYKISKYNSHNYDWEITYLPNPNRNLLREKLRDLGLECKSVDKFIPKEYLFSSGTQRMELLQGLIDTDGSVTSKGRISFSTRSVQLFEDVKHLCRSLGIQCVGKKYERSSGVDYEISILTNKEVFTSEKHKSKWQEYQSRKKGKNVSKYDRTAIVGAEYLGETEMVCISVDDDENLYITDDFIVTHNTFLSSLIVKEGYRLRYKTALITMQGLIDLYFKPNKTEEDWDKIKMIREADFLVIDELGKENFTKSGSNINLLEETLRNAVTRGQVIIICTNLPLEGEGGLYHQYGASIKSLIDGSFVKLEFDNSDYRPIHLNKKRAIKLLRGEED